MELSVIIAVLKQSKILHKISWGIFMATAITVWLAASPTFTLLSLLMAFVLLLIQTYFALRLNLDHEFFTILQTETLTQENLQQFDQTLHQLKLIKKVPTDRSMDHRIQGTMALVKSQVMYLALQALLYITIILILLIL